MGRQSGVSVEKILALPDYEAHPVFSECERAVLRVADAMSDTPADVDEQDFAALRAWFDDAQIIELCSAIAWENYRARFNRALGVGSDGFAEEGACAVPVRKPLRAISSPRDHVA